MKIYLKMIPKISEEIVKTLSRDGDIEVADEKIEEAALDSSAVLRNYVEMEKKLNEEVKDHMERRGLSPTDFNRVRDAYAKERNFKLGDDGIDFVIDQIMDLFMMSPNVDEVFAEDHTMRKKIFDILRRYLDVDEALDRAARDKIKNLEEGTLDWDIGYEKAIMQLKQQKGLV
ncbi:MAG: DUF507 family protein [Deltaproteobacteria bacterium]|nr:DUF507 family protein [Deltaproteobacteria bacterium]